ncbi:MAG: LuxR C-terminal-related transcriptional regulator, partial [Pirellula sp.]
APEARGGSTAMIYSQNIPDQIDENDSSEQTEYRSLVHRAMNQVRSEFEARSWQAFWRTTVDGIGVDQVAEELQMSKATIRQHRSRVLRRLRQQLGEIE